MFEFSEKELKALRTLQINDLTTILARFMPDTPFDQILAFALKLKSSEVNHV